MSSVIETDVVVVGAGLVGLSAALALHSIGKRVILVDAKQPDFALPNTWDQRIYVLTPGNVQWLQNLGVWGKVNRSRVNPIDAMRLWYDQAHLQMNSYDAHLSELGIVVEQQNLMGALGSCLQAAEIATHYGVGCHAIGYDNTNIVLELQDGVCVKAQLLLGADSARSWVRAVLHIATKQHDFDQTALVANFKAEKPHDNVAYQWFGPHQTLALLPLPNHYVSLVWSLSTELAQQKLLSTQSKLADDISAATGHLLGELKPASEVAAFALKQVTASRFIAKRAVLIGDAAHQVHPMAGQGVNLGFHDVIELTRQIQQAHSMLPLGDAQILRRYERARQAEVVGMHGLTRGLDALFALQNSHMQALTQWGFKKVGQYQWLKSRLIERAVL